MLQPESALGRRESKPRVAQSQGCCVLTAATVILLRSASPGAAHPQREGAARVGAREADSGALPVRPPFFPAPGEGRGGHACRLPPATAVSFHEDANPPVQK